MKKTTFFYVLKEVLHLFFIGLMTLTIILLMDKIFKLIELIVNRGTSLIHILRLLMFIAPSFLVFTIPMSILLATLLSFGRLSSDNEITAFKASGVSLYQLFWPVIYLAVLAYFVTTFLVLYGLPWGNRGFINTLYVIAQTKADIDIKERVFNDDFEGLVVYVDKVPIQGRKMEGVLIYDEREQGKPNTIFSTEGYLFNDPKSKEVILRLIQGEIHRFELKTQTYHRIQFDTYDLKFELAKTFEAIENKLKEKEMSIDEIEAKIDKMKKEGKDTASQEVEFHKRFSIPFACIVFAIIGVPLGIQPSRSGRSHGFVFSILIFLGYYIALTASETFAVRRTIPPFLAGWAPNVLFGSFGIYLLVKTANDSPFGPSLWLSQLLDFIQEKWRQFFENV
jgi:lipopolysaccharide export system permease protein